MTVTVTVSPSRTVLPDSNRCKKRLTARWIGPTHGRRLLLTFCSLNTVNRQILPNAVVFSFALWTYGWARGGWILHEADRPRDKRQSWGRYGVPPGRHGRRQRAPREPSVTPGAPRQSRQRVCTGFPVCFSFWKRLRELVTGAAGRLAPAPVCRRIERERGKQQPSGGPQSRHGGSQPARTVPGPRKDSR